MFKKLVLLKISLICYLDYEFLKKNIYLLGSADLKIDKSRF
jgi:hypothetical protein